MVELRTHKKSFKLAAKTQKTTLLSNATRWNSKYYILLRFLELEPILPACVFSEETQIMIPEKSESREISKIVDKMKDCMMTSKFLQNNNAYKVNPNTVHVAFDELISKYPSMRSHLDFKAPIVHSPDFESEILKIIRGQEKL